MFERNRHITDVAVLDVMLLKGYQEFQETMNCWKQTPHIMQWFTEEEAPGALRVDVADRQKSRRTSWASFTRRATRAVARRTADSDIVWSRSKVCCDVVLHELRCMAIQCRGFRQHTKYKYSYITKSTAMLRCGSAACAPGPAPRQRS